MVKCCIMYRHHLYTTNTQRLNESALPYYWIPRLFFPSSIFHIFAVLVSLQVTHFCVLYACDVLSGIGSGIYGCSVRTF